MPLIRIDSEWVEDEFGNRTWMPDPAAMQDPGQAPTFQDGLDTRQTDPASVPPLDPWQTEPPPGLEPQPMVPDAVSAAAPVEDFAPPPPPPVAPPPPEVTANFEQTPTVPAPATTVPGAQRDLRDATQRSFDGAQQVELQRQAAEKEKAEREFIAESAHLAEREKIETDRLAAVKAAGDIQDRETALWLTEVNKRANEKADPSRYFSEAGGFSQFFWVVSLLSGAISAGADQTKNIGLKMLSEEIDKDIVRQGHEIERKIAATATAGKAMDVRHARDLANLKDATGARIEKWTAARRVIEAQLKLPGPESKKLGLGVAWQHANEQIATLSQQALVAKRAEAESVADRKFQAGQQSARLKAQAAEAALNRQADMDKEFRGYKHAERMAGMAATLKAGASAGPKNGRNQDGSIDKDWRPVDKGTGIRLRTADGKESSIVVPKEQHTAVVNHSKTGMDQALAIANLRKAFVNSTGTERLIMSDAALESAYTEAVGPLAKAANGGTGPLTNSDWDKGSVQLMGMDRSSIISKLKGASAEEVLELLDTRLASLPERVAQDVLVSSGIELDPGTTIVFTPTGQGVNKDKKAPGTQGGQTIQGIEPDAVDAPTSPAEVRKALDAAKRQGADPRGVTLPALPPDLEGILNEKAAGFKSYPHKSEAVAKDALKAIDAWQQSHKGKGSKAIADGVRHEVKVLEEDATKRARAALDEMEAVLTNPIISGTPPLLKPDPATMAVELRAMALKQYGMDMTEAQALSEAKAMIGESPAETFKKGVKKGASK